jgi:hypothetical protein
MSVDCPRCEAHVVGQPHGYTITSDPRDGLPARWTLLTCEKEGHPLLVVQEELAPGMKFEEDSPHRVYPPQDRRLSNLIPRELRNAHEEARKCYRAKAYRAAVTMCGITLEGACQLEGAKRAKLQEMLEDMKNKGKIDSRLWEWAESLRHVRNSASHFNNEAVTRQDADDSLAFSEALLDYLFVLAARFEAMKQRRASS